MARIVNEQRGFIPQGGTDLNELNRLPEVEEDVPREKGIHAETLRGVGALERDNPRHRSRRKLLPALEKQVIETTWHTKPPAATHWSTRTLARHLGLSHMTVYRAWQDHELQPHRVETFKLSQDPNFEAKVRDVVGLYLNPPDHALVLCVDEESQIQALNRTAPILPLRPGLPERRTHDYERHGTTTLFAAFNILTGKVLGQCLPRHRGREFVSRQVSWIILRRSPRGTKVGPLTSTMSARR